jgi:hypothetical protein
MSYAFSRMLADVLNFQPAEQHSKHVSV